MTRRAAYARTPRAATERCGQGYSATFYLDIQNDGLAGGLWWIQGPGTANGFEPAYYQETTNVTSQVEGGGRPISLAVGAHATLKMVVKVAASSASSHTFVIRAVPAGLAGETDVVKAIVNGALRGSTAAAATVRSACPGPPRPGL